ncbi:fam-f protein, partial [Plasmodium relictum]
MKVNLVLLYYFLAIIVISVYFYGINRIYKHKLRLKFMKYKEIHWIRNLAESSAEERESIDNSNSELILEKELIGKNFNNSAISFSNLTSVLLKDYDKILERKKNDLSFMYNTLIDIKNELLSFLKDLLNDSKSHIDKIFENEESFNKLESEICRLSGTDLALHTDENDLRLLIDREDRDEYLKRLNLNKEITLKIENS